MTIRLEDPDTPFAPDGCGNHQDWGAGDDSPGCVSDPVDCMRERNGPHDPPEPQPSSFTVRYTHMYESSGRYSASFHFDGFYSCDSPYAERVTVEREITVTDALI